MKLYKCDLCSKEVVEDDVVLIRTYSQVNHNYDFEICTKCLDNILKRREYLKNRKKLRPKKNKDEEE